MAVVWSVSYLCLLLRWGSISSSSGPSLNLLNSTVDTTISLWEQKSAAKSTLSAKMPTLWTLRLVTTKQIAEIAWLHVNYCVLSTQTHKKKSKEYYRKSRKGKIKRVEMLGTCRQHWQSVSCQNSSSLANRLSTIWVSLLSMASVSLC